MAVGAGSSPPRVSTPPLLQLGHSAPLSVGCISFAWWLLDGATWRPWFSHAFFLNNNSTAHYSFQPFADSNSPYYCRHFHVQFRIYSNFSCIGGVASHLSNSFFSWFFTHHLSAGHHIGILVTDSESPWRRRHSDIRIREEWSKIKLFDQKRW